MSSSGVANLGVELSGICGVCIRFARRSGGPNTGDMWGLYLLSYLGSPTWGSSCWGYQICGVCICCLNLGLPTCGSSCQGYVGSVFVLHADLGVQLPRICGVCICCDYLGCVSVLYLFCTPTKGSNCRGYVGSICLYLGLASVIFIWDLHLLLLSVVFI